MPPSLQADAATYASLGLMVIAYPQTLRQALAEQWPQRDALIFALATGAVVRLIAPLLQDKGTDPAVVVVDEGGKFAISLCGGHQGGSDRLTHWVSQYLQTTPVLTGAANHQGVPGIDVLGQPFGWRRGQGNWTGVASAIARGEPVEVLQEAGTALWQRGVPLESPFRWTRAAGTASDLKPSARVWISPIQRRFDAAAAPAKVQWHPRVLWVGVGCERGTPQVLLEQAIAAALKSRHLAEAAIAGIATVDRKADEVGLLALCAERGWPLRCFTPSELAAVAVPNPSPVVAAAVGTPSVAEAAALLAAQSVTAMHPLVMAAAAAEPAFLRVTKQVVRHPSEPGAVTVAIAQSAVEYTGRSGAIALVGIGPGSLDQMTPAARGAIAAADVVIGYQLYADLIRPLLRPGQILEALPITQEQQRADRAIALARWGLSVAVISSGDCGIYGMAGLVLETLHAQGWDGNSPAVKSFPGISALQATAARVGAPLMHDFCAISLSDLLTPWAVIENRLRAAAAADFVVALYNPKSQKRTTQIEIAQAIFLEQRSPDTPVAIVRSAYRPDEQRVVTTLAEMLTVPIDMLTTVIIGNRSSYTYADQIITPRGYPFG